MRRFLAFLSVILVSLFVFVSCDSSTPKVQNVSSSVVFDYADEESFPDVYLSVFASPDCEISRIESIRFVHEETNLEWKCETLERFDGKGKKSWVGYTHFLPLQGSKFPIGRYNFYISDMAGTEEKSLFFVNYPNNLFESRAKDFPGVLKLPNMTKIALYNQEDVVIYYGDMQKEWKKSLNQIKDSYSGAVSYRLVYYINNGNILCLMPALTLD